MARYSAVAIGLHWAIAALVGTQIVIGLAMVHLALPGELSFSVFLTHRALGVTILALVACRIAWRLTHRPPALPSSCFHAGPVPSLLPRLASGTHGGLYVCQILSPLTGWALASIDDPDMPIGVFGLFDWPLLPLSGAIRFEPVLGVVHRWSGWMFAALIVLHAGAALWHGLVRRDGVMRRMMFAGDVGKKKTPK
ncbi:cytochrome b [Swaminathania salitolerans]|nr:cytochrome b [Swaminathania salitolerans]